MKLRIWTILLFLGFAQFAWGQTSRNANVVSAEATAPERSANSYTVLGATPQQEALVRAQIRIMQPDVYPLRVLFVPHWKYVDTARTFRLHVPAGYTSAMFSHLPSRSVFIDSDRYVSDDSLGYWLAHELGHLAANSASESDADQAAREYRKHLKDEHKRDAHWSPTLPQAPKLSVSPIRSQEIHEDTKGSLYYSTLILIYLRPSEEETMPQKVIEIVGASKESFAKAAENAVTEAAKTVRGMKWAHVTDFEMLLDGKKIAEYRATTRIYFDIER